MTNLVAIVEDFIKAFAIRRRSKMFINVGH
jgi:hypothetical protein